MKFVKCPVFVSSSSGLVYMGSVLHLKNQTRPHQKHSWRHMKKRIFSQRPGQADKHRLPASRVPSPWLFILMGTSEWVKKLHQKWACPCMHTLIQKLVCVYFENLISDRTWSSCCVWSKLTVSLTASPLPVRNDVALWLSRWSQVLRPLWGPAARHHLVLARRGGTRMLSGASCRTVEHINAI